MNLRTDGEEDVSITGSTLLFKKTQRLRHVWEHAHTK